MTRKKLRMVTNCAAHPRFQEFFSNLDTLQAKLLSKLPSLVIIKTELLALIPTIQDPYSMLTFTHGN